jgi:hypothetical protein
MKRLRPPGVHVTDKEIESEACMIVKPTNIDTRVRAGRAMVVERNTFIDRGVFT